MGTFHDKATVATRDEGTVSASVNEKNALLLAFFEGLQGFSEGASKDGTIAGLKFLAHIDDFDMG
jgi:hypothetical protein